jgi:hypothetical protein
VKTPSRSLVLTVVVFLIAATAAAWWIWRTTRLPTLSFIEFREDPGGRVALFALHNPGSRIYSFASPGLVEIYDAKGASQKPTLAGAFDSFLGSQDLGAHTGAIMAVQLPLVARGGEWAGRPFRFGVQYGERPREPLAFLPLWLRSWFPKSLRAPAPRASKTGPKIIWSEVVTP